MTQGPKETKNSQPTIVDFEKVRSEKMQDKRRKTERIFFKELLGVYTIADNEKLKAIEIVDMSEDGLAFQVPFDSKNPWPNSLKEMSIRLYFSQDTYLPVVLKIQNSTNFIDGQVRYHRFGCSVDQSMSSYPAYQQFVRFLQTYSEHAHRDTGDASVFYI